VKTHRAACVIALTAVLGAAGCSGPTPHPPATATASPPDAAEQEAEADHDDGPGAAPSVPPPAAALAAADAYVRSWARPQLDRDTWYAAIRGLATPGYAQLLADTDPANVPARAVTGPPRAVSSTAAVVVADVPTDTGTVRVRLTPVDGRWLVATCTPAQETR